MKMIIRTALILFFIVIGSHAFSQETSGSKKYYHTVLVKWVENPDEAARKEIMTIFKALPAKIDGFESIEIIDLAISTEDFDTVIIQVYTSEEAFLVYEDHPDHDRIKEIGNPLVTALSEFDYWK